MSFDPKDFSNFTELDFEKIKDSLKQYLQNQEQFKDYNFDGSALSTLLDILAYTTQYNAFYMNMHASERFLETAQRRENVVELAKNLGYIPTSSKGSIAFLFVSVQRSPLNKSNELLIPRNTLFTAKKDLDTFTFLSEEDVRLTYNPSTNTFDSNYEVDDFGKILVDTRVKVFESKKLKYVEQFTLAKPRITIPNPGVDIDKIEVTAKTNRNDISGIQYFRNTDIENSIVTITSEDTVFFVEETIGEKFAVYFGNGIIGKSPSQGQFIEIDYYVNIGREANGSSSFTCSVTTDTFNEEILVVNSNELSFGGSDIEPIELVKFNAPRFFERQNRAVTPSDYESVIFDILPSAYSVSAWGGENDFIKDANNQFLLDDDGDLIPAKGYVYISIIKEPFNQFAIISDIEKEFIESELRNKYCTITIFPEIVDPIYVNLFVESIVNYDSNRFNLGAPAIATNVKNTIFDFGLTNFSKFNTTFRYSNIVSLIDGSDTAIVSNDTNIKLYSESSSVVFLSRSPVLNFTVSIKEESITSSNFEYNFLENCYLKENTTNIQNKLNIMRIEPSTNEEQIILANVADIDYTLGIIKFDLDVINFNLIKFDEFKPLKVFATPKLRDISFKFNSIPVLKQEDIKVSVTDINRSI